MKNKKYNGLNICKCPPSPRVLLAESRNYSETKSILSINPYFVTGFIDAEGCFHIAITLRAESKFNVRVRTIFQIGVHIEELPLLLSIQEYFNGVGRITKDIKKKEARYVVSKPEDILKFIIPHLESYPLLTNKNLDFILSLPAGLQGGGVKS
jgi:hypothetical protein